MQIGEISIFSIKNILLSLIKINAVFEMSLSFEDQSFMDNPTTSPIKLSICSITYNQAPYIRECIDSFLMQKTVFPFEILIHDDASTDGTIEILQEYKEKYPDIIHLFLEKENQFTLRKKGAKLLCDPVTWLLPHAKGEYIALCEGDDYWTDPYKLQKQVDFLDKNQDFSGCCTKVRVYDESTQQFRQELWPDTNGLKLDEEKQGYIVTSDDSVIKRYIGSTLSSVFRKSAILKYFDVIKNLSDFYDFSWYYFAAKSGKLITFECISGVYRRHSGGITSANMKKNFDLTKSCIAAFRELNRIYPSPAFKKAIIGAIKYLMYSSSIILFTKIFPNTAKRLKRYKNRCNDRKSLN